MPEYLRIFQLDITCRDYPQKPFQPLSILHDKTSGSQGPRLTPEKAAASDRLLLNVAFIHDLGGK